MEILIISGLSGAGKSSAATYLEDMGYYTVDNVPADIILKFAEFCAQSDGRYDRVALVSDIRSGNGNFQGILDAMERLKHFSAVFVCTFPIGRIRWDSDWRFDWNRSHKRNRLDAEKIPETKKLNH